MTTKYYLDLEGLKALIQKIVANDNTEKNARIAVTGINSNSYSAGTATAGKTDYLAQASSLQDADRKLNDAISDVSAIASATSFKIVPAASTDDGYSADTYAGQYKLVTGDGNNITGSSLINIPKDQFLKNVEYFANSTAATTANVTVPSGTEFPTLYFEWQLDGADADSVADTTWVPVADLAVTTTLDEAQGENYIEVSGGTESGGVKAYTVGHTTALDNALSAGLTTVSADGTGTADTNKYIKVSATTTANTSTGAAGAYKVETVGLDNALANAKTVVAGNNDSGTADSNNYIKVEKSGDTGATPATYTVKTTGIDSAISTAVGAETDRAQAAEGEIADVVGLLGAEGQLSWDPTTNYGGNSTSAQANMEALDTQIKANADAIDDLTAADVDYVNTTSGLTATNVQDAIDELDDRLDDIDTLTNPLEDYDAIDITVDTTNHKTRASVNIGDGLKKTTTSGQLNKIEANVANGLEIDSTSKAIQVKAADNTISVTSAGVATSLKVAKKAQANTGFAATYQLVDGQGTPITGSSDIDILKDQFLKSVEYCTERKSGDASSLDPTGGYPALRFEWYVNEDGSDQNDQSTGVNYVSIAALGATGTFGAVDTTTNKGEIASPAAAGLATVGAVTTVVNSVRGALDSSATSSNGNNVNVTVTEENGLISAVSVTDNTKNVIANDVITLANAQAGDANGTQRLAVSVDGTTITKANDALAANTGALNYTAGTSSADATLTATSGDTNKLATVGDVADKVEDFVNDRIADELSGYKPIQTAVTDGSTATAADNDLVVTAVTQDTNGVVTVTKNNVGNMLMTGYDAKTGATNDDVKATDSVNAAIKKLEEKVDAVQAITTTWVNNAFDAAVTNPTNPSWPSGN